MTRRLSLSEGARPSLAKTLATCFSTTPAEMTSVLAMAAFERPWAMSERTSRSRGVSVARESARRLAPEKLADHFRVEYGAALRDPGDRVDEVADVGDAVLEQVADARRGAGEQIRSGPGLDVLGEDEHADLGMILVDRLRGPQSLIGMAGRHPHVDDGHVGQVRVDRLPQRARRRPPRPRRRGPGGSGSG